MKMSDERGAVMVESTYCILMVLFVLMFMLSFGFRLYQETVVGIVANEIAEDVVLTYKLRGGGDASTMSSTDISGIGLFRNLLFGNKFETKNETKAVRLADSRLTQTSLAKDEGGLDVNIEPIVDDVGRRHYEITVEQKYSFLLGDLLKIVGLEGMDTVSATAYVESVDVLNYVNTVKLTKYGLNKLSDMSALCSAVNSAISLWHAIFN